MKYFIVSGEASGDLHGSNLIRAIIAEDPKAEIACWGGDLMQLAGAKLVQHYKSMSFMGFVEVLFNLHKIFDNLKKCKSDITEFNPDVLIFIDFSGFNLRIAKWAKQQAYYTNYYISPQVWASRSWRVKKIKRDIDKMYVILPFEKSFYAQYNYEVEFVGHPLLDAINQNKFLDKKSFLKKYKLPNKPIIALLPGSRKQEIKNVLGEMLKLVENFEKYQFVIAMAPSQPKSLYDSIITNKSVICVQDDTYSLLHAAHAALVTSGTATLETALFDVPQVVCYKGSYISYLIAKSIIKLKYISLVNLIMNKPVVKELIQNNLNPKNLSKELQFLLEDSVRENLIDQYIALKNKLGGKGASLRAAKLIVENTKLQCEAN